MPDLSQIVRRMPPEQQQALRDQMASRGYPTRPPTPLFENMRRPIPAPLAEMAAGMFNPFADAAIAARDSRQFGQEMADKFRAGDYGGAASSGLNALTSGIAMLPGIPAMGGMMKAARSWNGLANDAGDPLTVYHGSHQKFDRFDAGEFGFHFGDKSAAEMYGDAKPFHLDIKNPFYIGKDLGNWQPEVMLRWLTSREYKGPGTGIPEAEQKKALAAVAKLRRQYKVALSDETGGREYSKALYAIGKPVRDLYESRGYDGIRYKNEGEGGVSYIAFRPEQVIKAGGGE